MLGYDDFRRVVVLGLHVARLRVNGRAVQEDDHVRILLDGARFAQVSHDGPVPVGGTRLRPARKLRKQDDRHVQLPRKNLKRARNVGNLRGAVVGIARGLHELQIVDHNEVKPIARFQLAAAAAQLRNGNAGRIVNVDIRFGKVTHRLCQPHELIVRDIAGVHALHIHARIGAEHAPHKLLAGHFQAEDADRRPALERGILRDVERKGGFAHGRAACHDDKVAALQAGGEPVKVGKARGNAGKLALELHQVADVHIGIHRSRPDMHERILGFLHRDVEDAPLRVVQHVPDGAFAGLRVPHDVRAGADQLAHDAAILHDADIMRNVRGARHEQRKLRDVGHAAHGIELSLPLQRVDERDAVHRVAAVVKLEHGSVNILVGRQIEVLGLERLAGKLRCLMRDQHAAEHAFFRFQAVRQNPRRFALFHGKHPFGGYVCRGGVLRLRPLLRA